MKTNVEGHIDTTGDNARNVYFKLSAKCVFSAERVACEVPRLLMRSLM